MAYVLKIAVLVVALAALESTVAKMRMYLVPEFLGIATALSDSGGGIHRLQEVTMGLVEFAAAKTLASSAVFLFITVLLIAGGQADRHLHYAVRRAMRDHHRADRRARPSCIGSGEAFVVAAMVLLVKVSPFLTRCCAFRTA